MQRDFSEEHIGMEITPLSIAVGHGQLEIVKLLIDNNADVNYRSKVTLYMYINCVVFVATLNR